MFLTRKKVATKINSFLNGDISREDIGWWALDRLVEANQFLEPGYETLLTDVLEALQLFHDSEPIMEQFYPEPEVLLYYLGCLKGEEMYQRKRVPHWKV